MYFDSTFLKRQRTERTRSVNRKPNASRVSQCFNTLMHINLARHDSRKTTDLLT